MSGAFQTSRDIFKHEIWQDVVKFRIFFYIVGNAVFSHEGIEVAGTQVKRGQFLRSLRNLQDDLMYREGRGNSIKKYPLTTIQRKIKSLEKEERITTKSTENGTLFTVVNYDMYQGFQHYQNQSMEQKRNSDGTETEQERNKNKKDNKENKEKKDIKTVVVEEAKENAFDFYQKNFGVLSPFLAEGIQHWLDDSGEDLVLEAMKLAIENNKAWKYAEAILRNWKKRNIKTLDDVEAAKLAFERNKQNRTSSKKPVRTEKLPDWFDEEEKPKEPEKEEMPVKHDDKYYKKLQLIEKMRKGGMWSEEKCEQELEKLQATKTG